MAAMRHRMLGLAAVVALASSVALGQEPLPGGVVSGFEPGHGFVSWFPAGVVADDMEVARFGEASLRLTSEGDGRPVAAEWDLPLPLDAGDAFWTVWVRVDAPAALAELRLQVAADDAWRAYDVYRLERQVSDVDGGVWLPLATDEADTMHVGATDASALHRLRIRVADDGSRPVTVHVDRLALVPRPPRGVVSITFDDGWASQAEHAVPAMAERGFVGSLYVIPYLTEDPRYMDRARLRALAEAGWEIGGHYHPSLEGRVDPELSGILDRVRAFVGEVGSGPPATFAYPEGYVDGDTVAPAVARRFAAGRTVVEGLETLPPRDPMRLRTVTILPTVDLEVVDRYLARAARERAWLILVIHKLVPEPAHPTEIAPERFERVLDLVAASGLPVRTVAEVIDGLASHDVVARDASGYPEGVTVPAPAVPAARIEAAPGAIP